MDSRDLWRYGLEWGREEVQGLGKVQRGAVRGKLLVLTSYACGFSTVK